MTTDTDNNHHTEADSQPEAADKPGIESGLFSRDPARQAAALHDLARTIAGLQRRIRDHHAARVRIAAGQLADAARTCTYTARALTSWHLPMAVAASLTTLVAVAIASTALLGSLSAGSNITVSAIWAIQAAGLVFLAIQYRPPRAPKATRDHAEDGVEPTTGLAVIADEVADYARLLRAAADHAVYTDTAPGLARCGDAAAHAEAACDILDGYLAELNDPTG